MIWRCQNTKNFSGFIQLRPLARPRFSTWARRIARSTARPRHARAFKLSCAIFPTVSWPIHALYPKNRHLLPKVRVFVDFLAEVFVGRAPVDTVVEVSTFAEKTVRYETQAHSRATNALFIAEYLGSSGGFVAQGWDMFIPLTNYFGSFQQTRLDDSPFTTPQWSYLDAIREFLQQAAIFEFIHGFKLQTIWPATVGRDAGGLWTSPRQSPVPD